MTPTEALNELYELKAEQEALNERLLAATKILEENIFTGDEEE